EARHQRALLLGELAAQLDRLRAQELILALERRGRVGEDAKRVVELRDLAAAKRRRVAAHGLVRRHRVSGHCIPPRCSIPDTTSAYSRPTAARRRDSGSSSSGALGAAAAGAAPPLAAALCATALASRGADASR